MKPILGDDAEAGSMILGVSRGGEASGGSGARLTGGGQLSRVNARRGGAVSVSGGRRTVGPGVGPGKTVPDIIRRQAV